MGGAIGFVTDKEVVVCPWEKKPDVELKDPSGELLTLYLDITLPALHQEAINLAQLFSKTHDSSKIEVTRARTRTGDFSLSLPVSHLFFLVWGVFAMKVTNFCVYAGSEIRTRQNILSTC